MLLAIDTGNTQTMVGLYDLTPATPDRCASTGLVDHWRVATQHDRTEDELAVMFGAFLADHDFDLHRDVSGFVVSSGVPAVTAALRRFAERYLTVSPLILGPGVKSGMTIRYEDPRAVGADRIANAVGATDLFGPSNVVVDFGTATTFDVIDSAGAYLAVRSSLASRSASTRCSSARRSSGRSIWSSHATRSDATPTSRSSPA